MLSTFSDQFRLFGANLRHGNVASLDKALLKSTARKHKVPKQKHIATLVDGCRSGYSGYVVTKLVDRLQQYKQSRSCLGASKTLLVLHGLLCAGGQAFQDEAFAQHDALQLGTLAAHLPKDQPLAKWTCAYGEYLDARVRILHEMQQPLDQPVTVPAATPSVLFKQLVPLVDVLGKLCACHPEGPAATHPVVVDARLKLLPEAEFVGQELHKVVARVTEDVFDMELMDAHFCLEQFKRVNALVGPMAEFCTAISANPEWHTTGVPVLQPLSEDLMTDLEEYLCGYTRASEASGSGEGASGAGANRSSAAAAECATGRRDLDEELRLPEGLTLSESWASRLSEDDPGLIMVVNKVIAQLRNPGMAAAAIQELVDAVEDAGMHLQDSSWAALPFTPSPNMVLRFFDGTAVQLEEAYVKLNAVAWAQRIPGHRDVATLFSVQTSAGRPVFHHFPLVFNT